MSKIHDANHLSIFFGAAHPRTATALRRMFWIGIVTLALAAPSSADEENSLPSLIATNVTATSTLVSKNKSYEPWYPLAPNVARFWCEGKPDEGIGEALTLTFSTPVQIDSLTLRAGVWKSEALFRANNIITGLDVILDDARTKSVSVPEVFDPVEIAIGGAPVKKMSFKITRVKKGRMNDSCISGIDLHTTPKGAILVGVDSAQVAALEPALVEIWNAIENCDAKSFSKSVQFPLIYKNVGEAEDTMRVTKYKNVTEVVKACKKLDFGSFHDMTQVAPKATTEAPGKIVMIDDELLEWHLTADGPRWKLTMLEDDTP